MSASISFIDFLNPLPTRTTTMTTMTTPLFQLKSPKLSLLPSPVPPRPQPNNLSVPFRLHVLLLHFRPHQIRTLPFVLQNHPGPSGAAGEMGGKQHSHPQPQVITRYQKPIYIFHLRLRRLSHSPNHLSPVTVTVPPSSLPRPPLNIPPLPPPLPTIAKTTIRYLPSIPFPAAKNNLAS